MLILTRQHVEELLTMSATIDAVEDAFRQLALGNVVMPQRVATTLPPTRVFTSPCPPLSVVIRARSRSKL